MSLAEHPFWPADKGFKPFDLQAPVQLLVPVGGPSFCRVCESPIGDGSGSFTPFRNSLPRPGHLAPLDPHRSCREQEHGWRKALESVEANPEVVSAQRIADAYQEAAGVVYQAAIDAVDVPEWVKEKYLAAQTSCNGDCGC